MNFADNTYDYTTYIKISALFYFSKYYFHTNIYVYLVYIESCETLKSSHPESRVNYDFSRRSSWKINYLWPLLHTLIYFNPQQVNEFIEVPLFSLRRSQQLNDTCNWNLRRTLSGFMKFFNYVVFFSYSFVFFVQRTM